MIFAFFAILSSICFGSGDYVGGIAAKRADLIFLMLANQIAGSASLLLVASLLTPFHLPGGDLRLAALAGASTAIGIPLLYKALAIGPMSIAAPVTALVAILLPVIYGISFLGEMPTWLAIVGFVLAGIAVFLLGGGDRILEVFKPASGPPGNALRGFLYALGAGTCIAAFYVAMKGCSPGSRPRRCPCRRWRRGRCAPPYPPGAAAGDKARGPRALVRRARRYRQCLLPAGGPWRKSRHRGHHHLTLSRDHDPAGPLRSR